MPKDKIAIAVALVAMLAGGGYWYWRSNIHQAPPPILVSQTQQPTNPAKPDISTWKTYRNEQYGFEVKYPPHWAWSGIIESSSEVFVCFMDKKYNFEGGECRGGPSFSLQDAPFSAGNKVKESRVSQIENGQAEEMDIYFVADGKKIYAECSLYGDPSVIQYCNLMLSTFILIK